MKHGIYFNPIHDSFLFLSIYIIQ